MYLKGVKVSKPRYTPPCGECVPFELNRFCNLLDSYVMKVAKRCCSQCRSGGPSTMSPLFRWGMSLLRKSMWCTAPKDKEGGFGLIRREELPYIFDTVLRINHAPGREFVQTVLRRSAMAITNRISAWERDPQLKSELNKPMMRFSSMQPLGFLEGPVAQD